MGNDCRNNIENTERQNDVKMITKDKNERQNDVKIILRVNLLLLHGRLYFMKLFLLSNKEKIKSVASF